MTEFFLNYPQNDGQQKQLTIRSGEILFLVGPNGTGKSVTWYIGGTLPDWSGSPLAIAVLLEQDNPTLAAEIGRKTLQAAMQP